MLEIGPLRVGFHEVPHFTTTYAVDIVSDRRRRAVRLRRRQRPQRQVVRFADGTDLLMIEATLPRPERAGPRGHLTPGEAGAHGQRARVRRLSSPTSPTSSTSCGRARKPSKAFGGPVSVAREGAVYTV